MGGSSFTWQLHNVSWLHDVDLTLILCNLDIVFLLKILCSLCDFGKCLLINRRKSFAIFVDTALLNGRLNHNL